MPASAGFRSRGCAAWGAAATLAAVIAFAVTGPGAQTLGTPQVVVEADGTVHMPAHTVPISEFMSPDGRQYLADHLQLIQRPEMLEQVDGIPRLLVGFIERQRELYPVDRDDTRIGDVHVYVYTPQNGVADTNRDRVLINLHGGGFRGCWPACAELESMPIAALGRITVISVDYRQWPEHRFPAASEDVAAVYRELLASHRPENIGIYGCSAGGMLAAMSVAWFQRHGLPVPGAAGLLCAGAANVGDEGFGGDATHVALPLGEGRPPNAAIALNSGYLEDVDPNDPLVYPANSPEVLAGFPPTLIVSGTRSYDLSNAVYTHTQLVRLGIDADLHVWEGMFHGYFYNPDVPESRETYDVIVNFFADRLGQR